MKKIIKIIALLLVAFFGGSVILLSTQFGGIRAFVVQSASMEPVIKTGSLIITKQIHASELKNNDIITFIRPDKTSEFVTHRITDISDNDGVTVIKTKGDNNETEDGWILAGGGVVGKMLFSIPALGYLLSLARTKIGIIILIIVPAIFIIADEIKYIYSLFKKTKIILPLILIMFSGGLIIHVNYSQALLSDQVSLFNNVFTVATEPVPTPTPTGIPDCPDGDLRLIIHNNGAGSINTISLEIICVVNIDQTNDTDIINDIDITNNSGDNTGGDITTGDTSTDVDINNDAGVNIVGN